MNDVKDPTPDAVKALVDAMLGDFGIPVEPEAPKAGSFETQSAAARLGVDAPIPAVRTPREKFLDALQAATVGGNARDIRFGKIPGQVSGVDAQKAMQHLNDLTAEQRMAAAREALAVQAAKQRIIQRVREGERTRIRDEFASKVGELLSGEVQQIERGKLVIMLNKFREAEAIMPYREQNHRDHYHQGDPIRAVLSASKKRPRGRASS